MMLLRLMRLLWLLLRLLMLLLRLCFGVAVADIGLLLQGVWSSTYT